VADVVSITILYRLSGASLAEPVPFEGSRLAADEILEAEIIEDGADSEELDHSRRRHTAPPTLLEQFMAAHGIKPEHLARESGYSRQFLFNLRMGYMLPSIPCMASIAAAIRRLTREPLDASRVFERALPSAPRLFLPPSGDNV
jgi:hypothetical protein